MADKNSSISTGEHRLGGSVKWSGGLGASLVGSSAFSEKPPVNPALQLQKSTTRSSHNSSKQGGGGYLSSENNNSSSKNHLSNSDIDVFAQFNQHQQVRRLIGSRDFVGGLEGTRPPTSEVIANSQNQNANLNKSSAYRTIRTNSTLSRSNTRNGSSSGASSSSSSSSSSASGAGSSSSSSSSAAGEMRSSNTNTATNSTSAAGRLTANENEINFPPPPSLCSTLEIDGVIDSKVGGGTASSGTDVDKNQEVAAFSKKYKAAFLPSKHHQADDTESKKHDSLDPNSIDNAARISDDEEDDTSDGEDTDVTNLDLLQHGRGGLPHESNSKEESSLFLELSAEDISAGNGLSSLSKQLGSEPDELDAGGNIDFSMLNNSGFIADFDHSPDDLSYQQQGGGPQADLSNLHQSMSFMQSDNVGGGYRGRAVSNSNQLQQHSSSVKPPHQTSYQQFQQQQSISKRSNLPVMWSAFPPSTANTTSSSFFSAYNKHHYSAADGADFDFATANFPSHVGGVKRGRKLQQAGMMNKTVSHIPKNLEKLNLQKLGFNDSDLDFHTKKSFRLTNHAIRPSGPSVVNTRTSKSGTARNQLSGATTGGHFSANSSLHQQLSSSSTTGSNLHAGGGSHSTTVNKQHFSSASTANKTTTSSALAPAGVSSHMNLLDLDTLAKRFPKKAREILYQVKQARQKFEQQIIQQQRIQQRRQYFAQQTKHFGVEGFFLGETKPVKNKHFSNSMGFNVPANLVGNKDAIIPRHVLRQLLKALTVSGTNGQAAVGLATSAIGPTTGYPQSENNRERARSVSPEMQKFSAAGYYGNAKPRRSNLMVEIKYKGEQVEKGTHDSASVLEDPTLLPSTQKSTRSTSRKRARSLDNDDFAGTTASPEKVVVHAMFGSRRENMNCGPKLKQFRHTLRVGRFLEALDATSDFLEQIGDGAGGVGPSSNGYNFFQNGGAYSSNLHDHVLEQKMMEQRASTAGVLFSSAIPSTAVGAMRNNPRAATADFVPSNTATKSGVPMRLITTSHTNNSSKVSTAIGNNNGDRRVRSLSPPNSVSTKPNTRESTAGTTGSSAGTGNLSLKNIVPGGGAKGHNATKKLSDGITPPNSIRFHDKSGRQILEDEVCHGVNINPGGGTSADDNSYSGVGVDNSSAQEGQNSPVDFNENPANIAVYEPVPQQLTSPVTQQLLKQDLTAQEEAELRALQSANTTGSNFFNHSMAPGAAGAPGSSLQQTPAIASAPVPHYLAGAKKFTRAAVDATRREIFDDGNNDQVAEADSEDAKFEQYLKMKKNSTVLQKNKLDKWLEQSPVAGAAGTTSKEQDGPQALSHAQLQDQAGRGAIVPGAGPAPGDPLLPGNGTGNPSPFAQQLYNAQLQQQQQQQQLQHLQTTSLINQQVNPSTGKPYPVHLSPMSKIVQRRLLHNPYSTGLPTSLPDATYRRGDNLQALNQKTPWFDEHEKSLWLDEDEGKDFVDANYATSSGYGSSKQNVNNFNTKGINRGTSKKKKSGDNYSNNTHTAGRGQPLLKASYTWNRRKNHEESLVIDIPGLQARKAKVEVLPAKDMTSYAKAVAKQESVSPKNKQKVLGSKKVKPVREVDPAESLQKDLAEKLKNKAATKNTRTTSTSKEKAEGEGLGSHQFPTVPANSTTQAVLSKEQLSTGGNSSMIILPDEQSTTLAAGKVNNMSMLREHDESAKFATTQVDVVKALEGSKWKKLSENNQAENNDMDNLVSSIVTSVYMGSQHGGAPAGSLDKTHSSIHLNDKNGSLLSVFEFPTNSTSGVLPAANVLAQQNPMKGRKISVHSPTGVVISPKAGMTREHGSSRSPKKHQASTASQEDHFTNSSVQDSMDLHDSHVFGENSQEGPYYSREYNNSANQMHHASTQNSTHSTQFLDSARTTKTQIFANAGTAAQRLASPAARRALGRSSFRGISTANGGMQAGATSLNQQGPITGGRRTGTAPAKTVVDKNFERTLNINSATDGTDFFMLAPGGGRSRTNTGEQLLAFDRTRSNSPLFQSRPGTNPNLMTKSPLNTTLRDQKLRSTRAQVLAGQQMLNSPSPTRGTGNSNSPRRNKLNSRSSNTGAGGGSIAENGFETNPGDRRNLSTPNNTLAFQVHKQTIELALEHSVAMNRRSENSRSRSPNMRVMQQLQQQQNKLPPIVQQAGITTLQRQQEQNQNTRDHRYSPRTTNTNSSHAYNDPNSVPITEQQALNALQKLQLQEQHNQSPKKKKKKSLVQISAIQLQERQSPVKQVNPDLMSESEQNIWKRKQARMWTSSNSPSSTQYSNWTNSNYVNGSYNGLFSNIPFSTSRAGTAISVRSQDERHEAINASANLLESEVIGVGPGEEDNFTGESNVFPAVMNDNGFIELFPGGHSNTTFGEMEGDLVGVETDQDPATLSSSFEDGNANYGDNSSNTEEQFAAQRGGGPPRPAGDSATTGTTSRATENRFAAVQGGGLAEQNIMQNPTMRTPAVAAQQPQSHIRNEQDMMDFLQSNMDQDFVELPSRERKTRKKNKNLLLKEQQAGGGSALASTSGNGTSKSSGLFAVQSPQGKRS
ncbi:unnamed protein product [Amoebophrya sp. A120]|nr:unnamed protein product [Amoebophrya sp. A120]|eukprot:GSA120T00009850001.1